MNKHVHKQGFNTFYVSSNHVFARNNDREHIIKDFENCLVSCIGAVAVFRLAIDPFPVLLMDYEIYSRTGDLLTESYSEEFVDKYIGQKAIEAYKQTEVYLGFYEVIMDEEQRQPCVLDIIKYQHIDKERVDEILNQAHLITRIDFLAVTIASLSEKIASIHCLDGWYHYTTSIKSARTVFGFHSSTFRNIKESGNRLNVPYDEAFLTFFDCDSDYFFLEHNEEFMPNEIESVRILVMAVVQLMNQKSLNNEQDGNN